MREPRMVEAAFLPPGKCFICGGNEGPMLDTMVHVTGDGRFYICERICLPLIGAAAGYASPAEVAEWRKTVADALDQVAELEGLLEVERAATLSKDDVSALKSLAARVRQQTQAKPKTGAAA